jgi:predicted nucleic acid-binding protein
VALFLNEPHSVAVADWYEREKGELVAAAWCIPAFASALGIKQRSGAMAAQHAQAAWARFERMVAADLHLLPVTPRRRKRPVHCALKMARLEDRAGLSLLRRCPSARAGSCRRRP